MIVRNSLLTLALLSCCAFGFADEAEGPDDAAPAETGTPSDADAEKEKWAEHVGDLPFIIGYAKGMKQVELTGKPPMYFFTTTWWGYCKKLAGSAFKDPQVIAALDHFTPILVDGDTEKEVVAKYGVSGYPNTTFADTKGEKVKQVVGAVPSDAFLRDAEGAAKKAKRGKPSKEYGKQMKGQEALTKALAKENVRSALHAIADIEAAGIDTPILAEAQAAKKALLESGAAQLKEAQEAFDSDNLGKAGAIARKLKLDYQDTDLEEPAGTLLDEIKAKKNGAE